MSSWRFFVMSTGISSLRRLTGLTHPIAAFVLTNLDSLNRFADPSII
jgi:hypothetical protein